MGSHSGIPNPVQALPALIWAGIFLMTGSAPFVNGQTAVSVQVAADKTINVMTGLSMGVYTDVYDVNTINPKVPAYMHTAGMYSIQFPGGYGSYADLFHWSTGTGTKYENIPQQDHFYPAEANMAHMVPFIEKTGTALITVNYGSNTAGTGGGEPAEAAAWVAYLNGNPASPQIIGKDSTGQDWKTVGYWATLRSQSPLATDDGLNLLRANHPNPLNIEFWQIGSEVYNNGYYGGDHKAEEDLHVPYPANESENEKRRKNPNLAPAFYGARLNEYSKAMKAVDPKVHVGATFNLAPIDSAWGADWNPEVLKAACANIDFETFVWRPDFRNGPDYQTRDEPGILSSPEQQIGKFLSEALYDDKKFCPAGHEPRVAVTQMAPIRWPKVIPSKLTDGLFAADAFALLIETGTISTDWNELHDGYFMDDSSTPGPAFYGAQMLHIVAHDPGDELVSATSNNSILAVHAAHRRNGSLGLILINKDPNIPAEVKVSISGAALGSQGTRFDYGPPNFKVNGPVTKTSFTSGGATFSVTIPPYTITDIILPKAP
jgi:hypothetical protein